MSCNLRNCIQKLELIANIKDKKLRNAVLLYFRKSKCLFKALREIAQNYKKANIPLTITQKRRLAQHRKVIQGLTKKPITKRLKAKLVSQSGGFLPIIIPLVTSILQLLNQ